MLIVSVPTTAALEEGDTDLLSCIPVPYNKLLGAKDYENRSRF
jgi:hypothetical protein